MAEHDPEVWRAIEDAPNYEVSSYGRVRSLDRTITTSSGQRRCYKGRLLTPSPCNTLGHRVVNLRGGSKILRCYVHRLVLGAFVGECPAGQEVRHLDGVASNNHLTNLAYGTPAQNTADKQKHGTVPKGASHSAAKLSEQDVLHIHSQLAEGCRQKDLAAFYGVTRTAIAAIQQGRAWAHVSPRYAGPQARAARPLYGRTP